MASRRASGRRDNAPVDALVVMAHDRRDRAVTLEIGEDSLAGRRVLLHLSPLGRRQRSLLGHTGQQPILPDVVDEPAYLSRLLLLLRRTPSWPAAARRSRRLTSRRSRSAPMSSSSTTGGNGPSLTPACARRRQNCPARPRWLSCRARRAASRAVSAEAACPDAWHLSPTGDCHVPVTGGWFGLLPPRRRPPPAL